ncbi:hypothetical protein GGS23DRAFT_496621 [Durotheca rogersii]|uniref:uncharacterized protein n=1 Tax=Durotheca rogersii TaxID=419775 RepID=UPI002220869A|nr:uncharacterized protein GGS23DRAFT_496621 [Durotheca rogersii]KAI5864372.1 hypothetical protein GGS23DRAFT_496621 [Durotheca rogersii]
MTMDPISAIGIAAGVLSFIDFAGKLVRGVYEVAGSANGAAEENAHIDTVIQDLKDVTNAIDVDFRGYSKHEKELAKLASQCGTLSRDLRKTLRSLEVQQGNVPWQAIKARWKVITRRDKIESMEKRIDKYRDEIMLRLQMLLVDQNSSVRAHLEAIVREGEMLKSLTSKRLEETREKLNEILSRESSSVFSQSEQEQNALNQIRDELKNLKSLSETVTQENIVLERLYFDDMYAREDSVANPSDGTYNWIIGEASENIPVSVAGSGAGTSGSDDDYNRESAGDSREGHREELMNGATTDAAPVESVSNVKSDTDIELPKIEAKPGADFKTKDDVLIDKTPPDQNKVSKGGQGEYTEGVAKESDGTNAAPIQKPSAMSWVDDIEGPQRRQLSRRLLQFLREGNGTFFVSGKAGSGKSTLMKFLGSETNYVVRDALREWAASYKLVFVSLYFWSAGSQLQRSLEGFYRSLLSQVLAQCPELTQRLLRSTGWAGAFSSSLANRHPFRLKELEEAVREIVTMEHLPGYRMCFFIDGLDEYEGDLMDHLYLARYLRDWSQHPNVKILCSARPHAAFIDTFDASGQTIYVHDFTKGDIYKFAHQMLKAEQGLRPGHLKLSSEELSDIASRIVDLSEGVFLWACLVVRSLGIKMGIYNADQLLKLLAQTPKKLNELYRGMLMKTDEAGRQRGDKMLVLALHNHYSSPLDAVIFDWIDELDDPTFPCSMKARALDELEAQRILDTVKRELSDLTAGLLEMRENTRGTSFFNFMRLSKAPLFSQYCVQPFHRTVKDFLLQDWFVERTRESLWSIGWPRRMIDMARTLDIYLAMSLIHSLILDIQ